MTNSNNTQTIDSYNTDKSINDSYNTYEDKSNSGMQDNKLDNSSVAVNNGGQGMEETIDLI